MSEINWSREQLDVINSVDSNTLVSASAGSGKTAVMIERLIRIILSGTPITQIIMVTFNNSVAQELRLKVSKSLKNQIENITDLKQKDYLREQIEMVPMANISTLHSLCTNIIRENFEIVGVDPSFGIIDEESASLLFDTTVNEILKEYESTYNHRFEMIYKYLTRNGFKDVIKKLYDFIVAQPDRSGYFEKIKEYSLNEDLNTKPIVVKYYELLRDELFIWKKEYEKFIDIFIAVGLDQDKYVDGHAFKCIDVIDDILSCDNIEQMINNSVDVVIPQIPKLSTKEKDDIKLNTIQNRYKDFNSRVRETIKELKGLSLQSFEEHRQKAASTTPYIKTICKFVAKVIDRYSEHKLEDNKLDFNDLEYYSVRILSNEDIADEYKNKYKYVCVDEYQDINAVQEFILNKISNGHNLFMVGDSKQSIYGFRQTDTNIFLNKLKQYKSNPQLGKAFYLNANYRSEKCVLDFVNEIFDEIMTEDFCGVDYKNESRLVFGQKSYGESSPKSIEVAICQEEKPDEEIDDIPCYPEGWVYSVENDNRNYDTKGVTKESLYIVNKIKSLVGKQTICTIEDGKAVNRLIELKDIAVLCAKRSDAKDLIDAFDKYGISADTSEMEMGETSIEVNTLVEILKAIDNPRQDYALIGAMTSFLGNITMNELVQIRELCSKKVEANIKMRPDGKYRDTYFYESVYEMSKLGNGLGRKVKAFLDILEKYRVVSTFSTVSDLLKRIVYENNFDEIMLMKADGKQRLNQVILYIDSLKDKSYNNSLSEFIRYADDAPVLKQISTSNSINSNSIIMSTLHQSKGLEYPIVFMIGCTNLFSSRGGKASSDRKILLDKDYGMTIPVLDTENLYYEESLDYHAMAKYQKQKELKERMRLLYVGLTRAKNMLFVTGKLTAKSKGVKKIIIPSDATNFMEWIVYAANNNEEIENKYLFKGKVDEDEIIYADKLDLKFELPKDVDYEEFINNITIKYPYEDSKTLGIKHTVTEINKSNYDEVQAYGDLNYDEKKAGLSNAAIGTAMHRALELIDFDLNSLEEVTKALDQMVADDKMLQDQRTLIDDDVIFKCLQSPLLQMAKGNKHYREKLFILNIRPKVLFPDTNATDRVMLEGVIDLLIETKKGYILVDYKHSSKSDSLLRKAYQTQLDLYASAIRLTTGRQVLSKNILVIDDGRVVNLD